jgi:hypothetical protein
MNTNIEINIPRIDRKNIFISLLLLILEIILFILIKSDNFYSYDISIQNSLSPNKTDNNKNIPIIITILYYSNKIFIPYIVIILVNNFSNIYNTFILFNILSIISYISCILKFIFYNFTNRKEEEQIFYYCGEGWNLPCTEIMISVLFYLSLWNLILCNENYEDKKCAKYGSLVMIVIFNFINCIYLVKNGYYLFSHLIFSIILAVLIYTFIFGTNLIKKLDYKKFCSFFKYNFESFMVINIILLLISFIPYLIERNIENDSTIECKSIEGSFFYKNKSPYKTYVDRTFSLMSIFFAHFFVTIGIKCELCFFFDDNILNFEQYHFGINIDDIDVEIETKNTGTIVITRETEWNNTSNTKSILRLIISFVLSGIAFLPYVFLQKENEYDFSLIFLVKYFFCFALFSFGITFLFKCVFKLCRLSNEILGSILNDQ